MVNSVEDVERMSLQSKVTDTPGLLDMSIESSA
jgi:GTP1/Obg family GTP-binding protein